MDMKKYALYALATFGAVALVALAVARFRGVSASTT